MHATNCNIRFGTCTCASSKDPHVRRDVAVERALTQIDEWVEETVADRAGDTHPVTADECYSDIVHAYVDTEVDDPKVRKEILRRTGVGERY